MKEYFEVMDIIKQYAAENANIIVGHVVDEIMANSISVTMVATGLTSQSSLDDEPNDVMRTFVSENNNINQEETENILDNNEDNNLNVFTNNSENDLDSMKAQADDEYDVPSFLRKIK